MSKLLKSLIASILMIALVFSMTACFILGDRGAEPSADSFEKAYEEKIDELMAGVGNYYDRIGSYKADDMKVNATMSVNLSKELLNIIRSYTSYDFKWLNDAEIQLTENMNNGIVSMALALVYNDYEVIGAEAIMDFADGNMFLGVPLLNSKFAEFEGIITEDELEIVNQIMGVDFTKLLPSEEILGKVSKDVIATIMDSIDVDQFSFVEKELDANGVKQSCVEYEVTFTEKELVKIAINILKMLKSNTNFKSLICGIIEEYNKIAEDLGVPELGSSNVVYNELKLYIADAIDYMTDILHECSNKTVIIWTSYITDKLDIIGMQLNVMYDGDKATLFAASAQDGDDVGVEVYFKSGNDKVAGIYGELVDDGKEISGTYELKVYGKSMAFIDIEGVDANKLEEGYFVGTVILSPSKKLLESIDDDFDEDFSIAGIALSSLALKIDIEENSQNKSKVTISIMSGSSAYASITLDSEISAGEKVTIPNKTTDIYDWAEDLDFDSLIESIDESGLPDYIVELIEAAIFGY